MPGEEGHKAITEKPEGNKQAGRGCSMTVYQCEDSAEGIFTAIYNIYEEKRDHRDTMISLTEELFLFAEYVKVTPDREKALKVMRTLKRKFGEKDYEWLCLALASEDESKAQAVYQTVAGALRRGAGEGHLFDDMACDNVNLASKLGRKAWNECHHLMGFVRFQELEGGILYSRIEPKSNALTFLMPHFEDRFPNENFMIYDVNRDLLGLHAAGKPWCLMQETGDPGAAESFRLSEGEQIYQELFRFFCRKITIEERKNDELQRNMLPLRFRKYMVEFEKAHCI